MKLPTTNSLTNGFPLVIATQTQQPTARLLLRNTQGQVVQQWLVKQNKCTLGSAASCSLRCQLSGVAPYHALLVIGARQIFIRALAPKLTRDGRPFNELLLTDEDSHFELAGHRFELTRNSEELRTAARPENSSPERIKFTLARPFELRNRPQSNQLPYANENETNAEPTASSTPETDSKWVAQLIQAAIQPLECQLHNLIEPLNELQNESRKQRRLRKKRARRKRNSPESEPGVAEDSSQQTVSQQFSQQVDEIVGKHTASIQTVSPQFAQQVDEIVGRHTASIQTLPPQFAQQVEEIVSRHAISMEVLTERILDVNQQLSSIERIVAQERLQDQDQAATLPSDSPQLALQSAAIEQLQHGIVTVSSALERLQVQHTEACESDQQWKTNLQSQLEGLTHVIDGLSTRVAEVHHVALSAATPPTTIQSELIQPAATNQPWPTGNKGTYEERNAEANTYVERAVADPSSLETSGDSLAQDEFHVADEAMVVDSAAPRETIPDEFDTADAFDEFSQLQSPSGSGVVDESIDDREPDAIEMPRMRGVDNVEHHAAQHSTAAVSEPPSSSLPNWWVDDESEESSANQPVAPQAVEPPNDYDSVGEPIAPDSRQVSSPAIADELSKVEEPSEEFYGLAQLSLEDHLREAEPLPAGLVHNPQMEAAKETPPKPDADGEFIGFGEPFAAHPNPTSGNAIPPDRASGSSPEPVVALPVVDEVDEDEVAATEESPIPLSGSTYSNAEEEEDEDGSVEEYMRQLLARMRGVPEAEVELSKPAATVAAAPSSGTSATPADRPAAAAHPRAHIERPMPSQNPESEASPTTSYDPATQAISAEVTEPFDPEKYMPRTLGPERSKSLAAMRELANSSARTAIHRSTRQRHVSSILLKAVIAIVGLLVGIVLVGINGFNMNIGLVATVASFLVAAVWGYDSISSIRPMLQNGLVLKPQPSSQRKRAPRDEEDD